MASKENLPPRLATPPISKISPSNKPALGRQRDHSACRADTPLKVKKTRENLKQASLYAEVPPPCLHMSAQLDDFVSTAGVGDSRCQYKTSTNLSPLRVNEAAVVQPPHVPGQLPPQSSLNPQSKVHRQKSVSRRMLSRVKQGISSKSKPSQSIRSAGSETRLARKLSGRRNPSSDVGSRSQSFELSRDSIESAVGEISGVSAGTPPPVQRSFTDSTVSTSEILEDLASVPVPSFQAHCAGAATEPNLSTIQSSPLGSPSSPSPGPTLPPLRKSLLPISSGLESTTLLAVPCVDLKVTVDCTTVDVSSKRDVWVLIDASIQLKTTKLVLQQKYADDRGDEIAQSHSNEMHHAQHTSRIKHDCGTITNLRLCYKPAEGCRIRNIIGQKSYKDLEVGQQCTLFIRVGVPRMQTQNDNMELDQESLFAELESIVGTLETDVLHVEARYRHSILPSDNIVALKHTCKVVRPKTESRWSIIGLYEKDDTSAKVHTRLARYLTDQYAADEALELLYRYFDYNTRARPGLVELCSMLQARIDTKRNGPEDQQPEVIVTDIDLNADSAIDPGVEQYDTTPSTPSESKPMLDQPATAHKRINSASSLASSSLAPPMISAPRTTTAMTASALVSSSPGAPDGHESHDTAHQLWRHIRRTSLSVRQLEDMTPERLSQLEAGDDSLKELRRRAIANKRSIGAETLRAWKWEGDMQTKEKPAEAPWM